MCYTARYSVDGGAIFGESSSPSPSKELKERRTEGKTDRKKDRRTDQQKEDRARKEGRKEWGPSRDTYHPWDSGGSLSATA